VPCQYMNPERKACKLCRLTGSDGVDGVLLRVELLDKLWMVVLAGLGRREGQEYGFFRARALQN
jgi:hypothetical protein